MITTEKHFQIFKKECERCLKEFGINNYSVRYEHKKLESANARSCNRKTHSATLCLNSEIDFGAFKEYETLDEFIKRLAKHETIHILIGKLDNLACDRFITETELESAVEELVVRLEKLIK